MTKGEKDLTDALRGLFEHCAMIHKHWGDESNKQEADDAIKAAQTALRQSQTA